jgi:hypothetical protein
LVAASSGRRKRRRRGRRRKRWRGEEAMASAVMAEGGEVAGWGWGKLRLRECLSGVSSWALSRVYSLAMQTPDISSSIYHIKYLNLYIEY